MPKSKGASAPAFLVISTQQQFATCTGARERLIAAGLCQPHQFPQGRARKYYGIDCTVSKSKGGMFKWESCHQRSEGSNSLIKYFQINDLQDGNFNWRLVLVDRISKDIVDEQMRTELWDYGRDVFRIARDARERAIKISLTLVKPVPVNSAVQHAAQPAAIQ